MALGTEDGLAGKWAELLKEAVPNATQVAVLGNPDAPGLAPRVKELRSVAATLKLALHIFEVRRVREFDSAFNAISKAHIGGLIVVVDPLTLRYRETIVRLAAQTRLPAVYGFGEFVRSGGFIAYGPRVPDQARRAMSLQCSIVSPLDSPLW